MRLTHSIPVLAVTSLALAGCAKQTFEATGFAAGAPDLEQQSTFFIGGLGQEDTVDAAAVCGGAQNVAAVESELEPLDAVLGFVTISIYSPRTMRVYCS